VLLAIKNNTVESRFNGPASNGNPPITEAILQSLEKIFFIGNNRNPPKTDRNGWSLEIPCVERESTGFLRVPMPKAMRYKFLIN